ncbi:MAG: cupin domain-containing protein [Dehalococcoidia bacterium]|nr:cupin domain-containing protein [Dehalococcoidia bacterium]
MTTEPGEKRRPESEIDRPSAYDAWVQSEGVPVIKGYYIDDLNGVALGPWKRKGGNGAFINLVGSEGSTDAYICEIPPGKNLEPQHHLYEEMIYILSGRGATTIWNEGGTRQTFEWQEGSLFAIPINAWHQHFNGQGDKLVRYLGATNAPLVVSLFHNMDFVLKDSFVFKDRYSGEHDYFTSPGDFFSSRDRIWETNFVPDVRTAKLYDWKERGASGVNIRYELADNTMAAHISQFPEGTYKKAHRHGPGANVIIISGTGYSLIWPEGQPKMKIDWKVGSMFVPPDRWFHQHFNTGREPAKYLALRMGSRKNILGKIFRIDEDVRSGGDQIEYKGQEPEIEKMFGEELAKKGLKSRMAQFLV